MQHTSLLPPGTWCTYQAIKDILNSHFPGATTFVDVGCGNGALSKMLLTRSLQGTGIDFSEDALAIAERNLSQEIAYGRFNLLKSDITKSPIPTGLHDFGVSSMVMEHIEDDVGFVKKCCTLVKPGGHFVFAVPSRMKYWSLEDELAGHLRRYERDTLLKTLTHGGLKAPQVHSVAVPISNCLFFLSKLAVQNSNDVARRRDMTLTNKTKISGIQEIPWKTVFPASAKLLLNQYTLAPLFWLQRYFYNTDLGLVMVGWGEVKRDR